MNNRNVGTGARPESRTQTIIRITRLYANERTGWLKAFTLSLVEQYEQTVAPQDRRIRFNGLDNSKKFVQRCIENNGDMRFPSELEEAWVLSLPSEYRYRLLTELNDRYGCLTVFKHELPLLGDVTLDDSARLMKETGEALAALAELMTSHGKIDYRDYPFLNTVKCELSDVASWALTLEQCVVSQVMSSMAAQGASPSAQRH